MRVEFLKTGKKVPLASPQRTSITPTRTSTSVVIIQARKGGRGEPLHGRFNIHYTQDVYIGSKE